MRKMLSKLGIEESVLNMINKGHLWKTTANYVVNCERLKAFFLRLGARQRYLLLPLLFNIVLEVLARVLRQEK